MRAEDLFLLPLWLVRKLWCSRKPYCSFGAGWALPKLQAALCWWLQGQQSQVSHGMSCVVQLGVGWVVSVSSL